MNDAGPEMMSLFCNARERISAEERAAYLDEACGQDHKLRARLEELLRAHEEAGGFLPSQGGVDLGPATSTMPGRDLVGRSIGVPGAMIGPYKLLQQIGEGGMGIVFMAEQTQPVQRKVALKLIKPGMDSGQVIARFEAERQALAMMDHVNIARVLDAGTTSEDRGRRSEGRDQRSEDRDRRSDGSKEKAGRDPLSSDLRPLTSGSGRPYFVMELVNGVPITKYCDDNHLTPRERLELFVPVCQAIQHAHQKGIIHRDIKPSNVMITLYDGKPVPKVIDFGVAKATEQRLTERTLFTQYGTMVGTLEYMSPEQAEMSALGVDTRSDVYSLGVLMYELLTGSTPLTRNRIKEAAFGEILRIIKEEEPQKPSTRLSQSGEALASISTQRQTEPTKLSKLVKGELDWIVMKTLEKDRNRRYESASAFAADVERYLNDEPVQACPPSASYRMRKFARRNKTALTTLAAIALALLLGTGISIWQAVEARRARWLADERLEIAEEQRQLAQASYGKALEAVKKMLVEVGDETVSAIPEMQKWREHLLEEAITFYGSLIALNPQDDGTYFARGHVYRLLGKFDPERADLEKAIELEPLKAEYHHILAFALRYSGNQTDFQQILFHQKRAVELTPNAATRSELARIFSDLGRKDEAIVEYRKAAEAEPDTFAAYSALAEAAQLNGNLREARLNREKAVECALHDRIGQGSVWDYSAVSQGPTTRAWAYNNLSHVLHEMGDDEQALIALNRSLGLTGVSGHARAWALFGRAEVYASRRDYAAALTDYDRGELLDPGTKTGGWFVYKRRGLVHFHLGHYQLALADIEKGVELRPNDVSHLLWIPVATVAACPDEGFRKGILALADRNVEILRGKPDADQGGEADAFAARAQLLAAMKQPERARADFERASALYQQRLEKQKATLGPDHAETLATMWDLVETGAMAGKFDRVEPVLQDVLERSHKKDSLGQPHRRLALLGKTLVEQERFAQAEPILRECLAMRTKELPESWQRFNAASMLGCALLGQKKFAAAEPLLLQGYEGLKQREEKIIEGYKDIRLTEAAERLVRLYEAINQPQKASAWREKMKPAASPK